MARRTVEIAVLALYPQVDSLRTSLRRHSSYTLAMCGRYRLARKKEILAEVFDVENDVDWTPRYNIAPGQDVAVVRQDATRPVRLFSLVRWGLIPSWTLLAKYHMTRWPSWARAEVRVGAGGIPFQ